MDSLPLKISIPNLTNKKNRGVLIGLDFYYRSVYGHKKYNGRWNKLIKSKLGYMVSGPINGG